MKILDLNCVFTSRTKLKEYFLSRLFLQVMCLYDNIFIVHKWQCSLMAGRVHSIDRVHFSVSYSFYRDISLATMWYQVGMHWSSRYSVGAAGTKPIYDRICQSLGLFCKRDKVKKNGFLIKIIQSVSNIFFTQLFTYSHTHIYIYIYIYIYKWK